MAVQARYRPVHIARAAVEVRETPDAVYVRASAPLQPYAARTTDRLLHWAETAPERSYMARKEGGAWAVSDGQKTRRYDHLVMAFPVAEAIKCFESVPAEVTQAVRGLRYNALRVAFIAVNNESLTDKSAVYIPDPTVHPHRVCYMGFFSPNVVRPGTSSMRCAPRKTITSC